MLLTAKNKKQLIVTNNGINFDDNTQPICLPYESNEDPDKWLNRKTEVLGFATKDYSSSEGDVLRAAGMTIFNQTTCNVSLDKKLQQYHKYNIYQC